MGLPAIDTPPPLPLLTSDQTGDAGSVKKKKKKKRRPVMTDGGLDVAPMEQRADGKPNVTPRASSDVRSDAVTGYAIPMEWTTVVKRNSTRKQFAIDCEVPSSGGRNITVATRTSGKAPENQKKGLLPSMGNLQKVRKVSKRVMVVTSCPAEQYVPLIQEAQSRIRLSDLEINKGLRNRRTAAGALSLEIPGPESEASANRLAEKLSELFATREGVRVSRPCKTAELRVRDLTDDVTVHDIAEALARAGGCPPLDIRVGVIRPGPGGLGTAWVRCPLVVANKVITGRRTGRIVIGWWTVRIKLLEVRPLKCFKCLEGGHVVAQCKGVDRNRNLCFRCGDRGHVARDCQDESRCPVCSAFGLHSDHRAGSGACEVAHGLNRRGGPLRAQPSCEVPIEAVASPVATDSPLIVLRESGLGYIAVDWGPISVIGVYISPNVRLAEFENWLVDIGGAYLRCSRRPVIIAGEFNAESLRWGAARTDPRGESVVLWAEALELTLINVGAVSTVVQPRGKSVVDLTWANPAAERFVRGWRVAVDLESLSDHLYIEMEVSTAARVDPPARVDPRGINRAFSRLDSADLFHAAIVNEAWSAVDLLGEWGLEKKVAWFCDTLYRISNMAMSRTGSLPRRSAYWWSEEIAELRRSAIAARRHLKRARRRRGVEAPMEEIVERFRAARASLKNAIWRAKTRSWNELIHDLYRDPWERPYRLIMNKLRPLTEMLDPYFLEHIN